MSVGDTRWSLVRQATEPAGRREWQAAWDRLTATYCPAMERVVRRLLERRGGGVVAPDEAADVVQAFLAQCVEKGWLARADPAVGRFRTFVFDLLVKFAKNAVDARRARKRAPKEKQVSLQGDAAPNPADRRATLEVGFRLEWTRCLVDAGMASVETRSATNARVLRLLVKDGVSDPAHLAAALDVPESRIPLLVHRARRMLAEEIWEQIKETCIDPEEREEEALALDPFLGPFLDAEKYPSFHDLVIRP